ncbi:chlorophyll synthesis pathway protein BchC [Roseibium sp. RKSG952]|uniref:chlorophyll synthesis pathway protein BchC n=1 Tax=Roseibium sp. RKSG952 TaxID=2529384 RepID=UPI0012BCCC78|nr:chlorophyll synthesis pathway protein BchC [Roseibium sp. RKSG952]MTH98775.1 chlorophyll synthesis pathway protein BchC [Roseibium sp. RKSG952]
MKTNAVLFEAPNSVAIKPLHLKEQTQDAVLVKALWSGISSGTEKRLFDGTMPFFPGLQYPLVPGYETVGRVLKEDAAGQYDKGTLVLVPGADCYREAAGLFGATAATLIAPAERVIRVDEDLAEDATLLSLAATAHHAVMRAEETPPDLVIGHGVLGRLVLRIMAALGLPLPTVWETDETRRSGNFSYIVTTAETEPGTRFAAILDASGTPDIIDLAVSRLMPGGTIILAGFYDARLSFGFPAAFMREASIRISTEFRPADLAAVTNLIASGKLSLKGLITHSAPAGDARQAYETAFRDPACVKMILDWRTLQ